MRKNMIVIAALNWVGTPYRHQASVNQVGADCLGLVRGVWRDVLGDEPEQPPAYGRRPKCRVEAQRLTEVANAYFLRTQGEPQFGDLLLFRMRQDLPVRHCAILIDANRFVHALERRGVVETEFDALWRHRLHSFYQFPEGAK